MERTKPKSGRSAETEVPAPCAGLLVRVLTLDGNSAIAAQLASPRSLRQPLPSLRRWVPAPALLLRGTRLQPRLRALSAAQREGSLSSQVRPEPRPRPRRETRPFNPSITADRSSRETCEIVSFHFTDGETEAAFSIMVPPEPS